MSERFGVSQAVTRREDQRLLTGQGQFTDDKTLPGCAHGLVFRTPVAHARITQLDCDKARQAPGVLAVYTAAELAAAGVEPLPCMNSPTPRPGTVFTPHLQPVLVGDVVRCIGDALAFIVAETLAQARDAAELIELDYQPLDCVIEADTAVQPEAPQIWDDTPGNICFDWELGDAQAVQAAFDTATSVVRLSEHNNRVVLGALETRAAVADYTDKKLTLYTGTQMPNPTQAALCQVLQLGPEQLRVVVNDVGGGFGGKNSVYPEQVLVLLAARELGRPVRWQSERNEGFISDFQGRDNFSTGELALDAKGHFLALRVTGCANLGAYTAGRGTLSPINVHMGCNVYRIPAFYANVQGIYTNTVPTDVYRGAGRPEILYLIERLVDAAAFDLGIDRIELRRRNLIPPNAFPYTTPTGLNYEQSDFSTILDKALAHSDWAGFEQRRARSAQKGQLRGIGLALYIERCGGGGGLSEAATLRFKADGSVSVLIGSMSNGQGHETAYSQIVHERLGLPFEKIFLIQGDTDQVKAGRGTGGSWSIPMGGGALSQAADDLIENSCTLAAELLEASVADIAYEDHQFQIAGTDRSASWNDLVKHCNRENISLLGEARYQPTNYTFPYGCHVCEVEIDPDTGHTRLLDYLAVHDFGHALNPLLLAGQVHGGLAQGIGQALLEHTVYDPDGQLLSGSFMDYCLPKATDLPAFQFDHQDTPAPGNPLGVKGCGEAGAAGSPPALVNAIVDALKPYGIRHVDMPATAQSIWRTLHSAAQHKTA